MRLHQDHRLQADLSLCPRSHLTQEIVDHSAVAFYQNIAIIKIVRSADRQLHFDDHRRQTGWGGPRPGAGRPAGPRPRVHHVRRPPVASRFPSHVTVRVRRDVPSLRSKRFVREFRRSLREACERGEFRVVHFSIQRDHAHLVVESAGKAALGRGMKSIAARLARAANRVFRRHGPVLDGRYHLRVLRTPREVRNAVAYVLLNARKHWRQRNGSAPAVRIDSASSGAAFDGWRSGLVCKRGHDPPAVARPRTWLLLVGWRRHGLIDLREVPGRRP